jgi:hypothetical protein
MNPKIDPVSRASAARFERRSRSNRGGDVLVGFARRFLASERSHRARAAARAGKDRGLFYTR